MKIRIKDNTIRFRLTRPEVEKLCQSGTISSNTHFVSNTFSYKIIKVNDVESMNIDFKNNTILLKASSDMLNDWDKNQEVGFYKTQKNDSDIGRELDIILEKDFTCLENRDEDQSDNYPNPKANSVNG